MKIEKPENDVDSIDFTTFIFSSGSAALIALGESPDPTTKKSHFSPLSAKQNIDIIALIQEKTKGNLTNEESDLISRMLSDLQVKYVSKLSKL